MNIADIAAKFPIPFAQSAGIGFIRNIPLASQIGIESGAASLTDGFPPASMTPISGGGTPPFGQDMNGLMKQVTQWTRWAQAGGPVPYDSTFQGQISGYPKGAVVQDTASGIWYYNLTEDNLNAPASGVNWVAYTPINLYGLDTGTQNAGVVTIYPAPASYTFLTGRPIRVQKNGSSNSGNYTLNVVPLGIKSVLLPNGAQLPAGTLPANGIFTVVFDGTNLQLQGVTSGGSSSATGQLFPSGYITLPLAGGAGTFMLQWMTGPWDPAGNPPSFTPSQPDYVLNWPIPFPNNILAPFVSTQCEEPVTLIADVWYVCYSATAASVRIQRQSNITGAQLGCRTRGVVIGIGF